MKACVHCGTRRCFRRNLCCRCYLTPDIRVQYPSNHDKLAAVVRPTHCLECKTRQNRTSRRDRGLCSQCFDDRAIRSKYPSAWDTVGAAKVYLLKFEENPPFSSESTTAMPGSEEKIQVMELRASLGQQIFHPNDAVLPRMGRKTYRLHLPARMKHAFSA